MRSRDAFFAALTDAAERDERIWALTGDLGIGLFDEFERVAPGASLNVGIAEQALVGITAGLAYAGQLPVAYPSRRSSARRTSRYGSTSRWQPRMRAVRLGSAAGRLRLPGTDPSRHRGPGRDAGAARHDRARARGPRGGPPSDACGAGAERPRVSAPRQERRARPARHGAVPDGRAVAVADGGDLRSRPPAGSSPRRWPRPSCCTPRASGRASCTFRPWHRSRRRRDPRGRGPLPESCSRSRSTRSPAVWAPPWPRLSPTRASARDSCTWVCRYFAHAVGAREFLLEHYGLDTASIARRIRTVVAPGFRSAA